MSLESLYQKVHFAFPEEQGLGTPKHVRIWQFPQAKSSAVLALVYELVVRRARPPAVTLLPGPGADRETEC